VSSIDWVAILIAIVWLGMVFLAARQATGSWASPGAIMPLYWLMAIVVPMIAYPGGMVSVTCVVFICIATSSWALGSVLGGRPSAPLALARPSVSVPATRFACVLASVAGLAAAALVGRAVGASLSSLSSLDGLLSAGNAAAVMRYDDFGVVGGLITSPLLGLAFAGSILAPSLIREGGRSNALIGLLPISSVVLYSTISTARAPMLFSSAMYLGGWFAVSFAREGAIRRISRRLLAKAGLAGAAVFSLFAGIAFVRIGRIDSSIGLIVYEKLALYAFGYLPAFSEWLDGQLKTGNLGSETWGSSSLGSMQYLDGIDGSLARTSSQWVQVLPDGTSTNVYSAFRNLILDFGISGTIIAMFVAGFLLSRLYVHTINRASPRASAALTAGYACIFMMVTTVITSYTNVLFGFLVAILGVKYCYRTSARGTGEATRDAGGSSGD
jgi:oligosaccharide repeat unit polymerase